MYATPTSPLPPYQNPSYSPRFGIWGSLKRLIADDKFYYYLEGPSHRGRSASPGQVPQRNVGEHRRRDGGEGRRSISAIIPAEDVCQNQGGRESQRQGRSDPLARVGALASFAMEVQKAIH